MRKLIWLIFYYFKLPNSFSLNTEYQDHCTQKSFLSAKELGLALVIKLDFNNFPVFK